MFPITAHEAPNGDLLLSVDHDTQLALQNLKNETFDFDGDETRLRVFASFIESTDYRWVSPEEIGAWINVPFIGVDVGGTIRVWALTGPHSAQHHLAENGRVRFCGTD